jgi:hypothetical protein
MLHDNQPCLFFSVFLREDGVLCEDVEMKIEVSHDVCQTVDNGEALGPLFVKIDENPVPVTVIKQKAVGFSRDQTLFLLSQMSAKVDILFDGGKARSMAELRDQMSARRAGMKKFWLDVASTLSKAFSLIFDAEKVRRKWQTLCDGYKNYVDNHNKTGSARSKFEWKDQMEELLGERHDVRPVVTASAAGVWVHRPLEMEMDSDDPVPVPVPEEVADTAEASPARKKKDEKNRQVCRNAGPYEDH